MRNTKSFTVAITLGVGATFLMALSPQAQPETPAQLPVGHPAVNTPNPTESLSPANPEDVGSIDSIIDAYYDSISGAKGEPRDWDRMLSLFMPDGRFIAARMMEGRMLPFPMSPQEFVDTNRKYFESGGYFEKDIHREVHSFGSIAQVFSTYASRRSLNDAEPYSRGINSIQLMNTGDRWWITTIMWDYEKPETNPIPERYLAPTSQDD